MQWPAWDTFIVSDILLDCSAASSDTKKFLIRRAQFPRWQQKHLRDSRMECGLSPSKPPQGGSAEAKGRKRRRTVVVTG